MPVVLTETDPSGIATLAINRPEALNALNAEVLEGLVAAVRALSGRAKAIIVTGAGKAFVAGADISQMQALGQTEAEAFARRGQAVGQSLADFPGPVIAAINGYALGGGLELAMACDILVASEKAVVGQPEVKLGVVPGFGGSQRLPRRTGPGIAKWLLMSGDSVKADEALRLGIVDKVVPPEALLAECRKIAEACLANGPLAIASAKRLVDRGLDLPLPQALDLEAKAFGESFATADQKEGMKAFLEKRKASFTGR
ncbi:MAG TPA: enoyl-CoA hydratase-related protein [Candidatus Thermoplasmatota archaeon]|nr:enoyl-CoA hydratase-related protein [Candidatus Thermoplasmatota archaeon]